MSECEWTLEISEWPDGFVSEILALLDRIEVEDDASLSSQRFDIARKYDFEVKIREQASSLIQ